MSGATVKEKKRQFYEYDKQLAAAFKIDCEEFLEEFERLKSLRFADFVKVWHLKNFTFVFAGHNYALLLRELCENYFYIVKKFIIHTGSVFTQIGALYMLYGLYYKQPLKTWVKIRLTLEEYKTITELLNNLKSRQELDAVFIFAKMKVDQAFVYTALPKPLGPEDRFVKSYETYLDYTFNSCKKEDTLLKFSETVRDGELIKDLEKTNDEYQELMRQYAEDCPSLSPFTSTIMQDLQEAHLKLEEVESSSKKESDIEQMNELTVRTMVKRKAMENKNAVYRGNKVQMAVNFGDIVMNEVNTEDDSDFDST